jgi:hypothetical protein
MNGCADRQDIMRFVRLRPIFVYTSTSRCPTGGTQNVLAVRASSAASPLSLQIDTRTGGPAGCAKRFQECDLLIAYITPHL